MKTDSTRLLEKLINFNNEGALENVEIYVGEINGKYDTEYSDSKKEVLDTIISDGDVIPNFEDNKISYIINDASYTLVTRYGSTNDKKKPAIVERVYLFINEDSLVDVRSCFLEYDRLNDTNLYLKIFSTNNYKGSVGNYKKDEKQGQIIYPSAELVEYNKRIHSNINSNIFLK